MSKLICKSSGDIEIVLAEDGELLELDPALINSLEQQFPEKNLIEIGEYILEALKTYLKNQK